MTIAQTPNSINQVRDWEKNYLQWILAHGRSSRTLWAYQSDLRVFVSWFEQENKSSFDPRFLTSTDLQAFRQYSLRIQQIAPSTWNRRRACLALLCEWAQTEGFIQYDPMIGVGAAEKINQAPRWLEGDEFRKLMRQVEMGINNANTEQRRKRAVRDAAIIHLMAFAGLREGEVCALQRSDLEISDRSGRVRVRLGKGEKYREVPLSLEVRRILGLFCESTPNIEPQKPLFFDGEKALTERAIQKRIQLLGNSAGVEDLTPHRLRHTCAKRMLDAGRPLTEVQQILGHAKLETTARYVQPGWKDLQHAVESISLGAAV